MDRERACRYTTRRGWAYICAPSRGKATALHGSGKDAGHYEATTDHAARLAVNDRVCAGLVDGSRM